MGIGCPDVAGIIGYATSRQVPHELPGLAHKHKPVAGRAVLELELNRMQI